MSKSISHRSQGNPCAKCGEPALKHDRRHNPDGNPCSCGALAHHHQKLQSTAAHREAVKRYYYKKKEENGGKFPYKGGEREPVQNYYVGIDGEGQGRDKHKYILLAWSNETGTKRQYVENVDGLSTVQCLDFILSIPRNAKPFAYAFGYDLTKILTDIDDKTLYKLLRPEKRQRKGKNQMMGPRPVSWKGYSLNLQGSKFTVRKQLKDQWLVKEDGIYPRWRTVIIWDIFKFFQGKFTAALEDWKVGEKERLERMREMKDKRHEFDKLDRDQIREYCFDECRDMAALAKKLTDAHTAAGLELRSYYGAGSTASCILKKMSIDQIKRTGLPEMDQAVASAFFGGRFENSVIGEIPGSVWGYDISSAYPYQINFLPCLACGTWYKTKNRKDIDECTTALVRYGLPKTDKQLPWGPFPFRYKKGSISFPVQSGGGWIFRDEFLAGERLFDNVVFKEAWVYNTNCDHQPFKQIPQYYLERLRIGKEGPGIVIKLGVNACYGKLAQSTGDKPPFQSWIWASMITSGTRGQLLDVLGLHKDWSNLLMIATDGVYSRERLSMPAPRDTGTNILVGSMNELKPLGGWEEKEVPKGLFLARPGVYFPLNPTEKELKQVRARGVGRATVLNAWQKIVNAFHSGDAEVKVANVSRFMGAKSCISFAPMNKEYTRSALYGEWINRSIQMSFDPMPKRMSINPDYTLNVRYEPENVMSMPYTKSVISKEALELKMAAQEIMEQPDGDLTEYDEGEAIS